jgi:MFS family permease
MIGASVTTTVEKRPVDPEVRTGPTAYAWLVMALALGLLLSDYMSRQLLSAVFPLLKAEWRLTDTQLGSLGGVVPLAVGVLTLPLSLLADRFGRVRSIAVMAILWGLATVACGLSAHFGQMLLARALVGVGEAAYGSVGVAVVVGVFPKSMRATIVSTFMAGGVFGSVLGVATGGALAERMGWRWSFAIIGLIGIVLGVIYPLIVRESRVAGSKSDLGAVALGSAARGGLIRLLSTLFPSRTVVLTYIGSGLQLFISASLIAWTPSFLNRYYALGTAKAAGLSAVLILAGGFGMIGCGILADWISRRVPRRQLSVAGLYCLVSAALVFLALQLPIGAAQLIVLGLAMTIAAGSVGPAGAVAAARADVKAHASVFATLTLANNFLGLAPGPFLTGVAADHWGLSHALQLTSLAGIAAAAAFWFAGRLWSDSEARSLK